MRNLYLAILTATLGAAVSAAPAPVADINSGSIEQRLETLERLVTARTNAQHQIQQQLDMMQEEVSELRGSVETHNYKLEQILQRQRELYLEIDKRMQAVAATTPTQTPQPEESEDTGNYVLSAGENEAYDRAVNLILRDKQYDQAIPEFQAFLQNYPESGYAANAHYWLGQLLFNKQEWAQAQQHFERVVGGFPDSTKRADSLLKLGIVAQRQSNLARAKQLFEQIVAQYPDSSARKLADARLRNLNDAN